MGDAARLRGALAKLKCFTRRGTDVFGTLHIPRRLIRAVISKLSLHDEPIHNALRRLLLASAAWRGRVRVTLHLERCGMDPSCLEIYELRIQTLRFHLASSTCGCVPSSLQHVDLS